MRIAIPVAAAAMLFPVMCSAQTTFRPPTATELWQLRGKCAELANSKLEDYWHDFKGFKDASSRYDPSSGHCYNLIQTYDAKAGESHMILFEGQTYERLALADKYPSGSKYGSINDDKWNAALAEKRKDGPDPCPLPPLDPSGAPWDPKTLAAYDNCMRQRIKMYDSQRYEDAVNYIKERMLD
jgi:hypothetical protein